MGSFNSFGCVICALIVIVSCGLVLGLPAIWKNYQNDSNALKIVSREEWKARPATGSTPMRSPLPYVVVHHGGIPKYCHDQESCSAIVRSYQNFHIDDRKWFDIGYSFLIGEDGNAYEGRGWNKVGAHAPGYNTQSVGICIMGDFSDFLPNEAALRTLNRLIEYGVSIGKISENYRVIGHRQARDTLCPGEKLFEYVKSNPRWTNNPVPKTAQPTNPLPAINETGLNVVNKSETGNFLHNRLRNK